MDELERFISNNREPIGNSTPPPQLWDKLHRQLDREQTSVAKHTAKEIRMVPLKRVWQVAAAVALLLTSFFGWQLSTLQQPVLQSQATMDWKHLAPELAAAEQYYVQEIHEKQSVIRQYDTQKYGIDPAVMETEIAHLDSVYQLMGQDLVESQTDERVVGAMIENLQMRIEILNRQLQILDQLQRSQKVEEVTEIGI